MVINYHFGDHIMNIFERHQCTLFLSLCFTNCSYEADDLFMFDKIHKICPPLNTWNGWSSFQEVCFQRQREEKGWAAAWWAKRSEFCCHLDPGDPFTPLPSAAITRSVQPYPCLLHDMKRKPCNQNEGRSDLAEKSCGKRQVKNQKTWTIFH